MSNIIYLNLREKIKHGKGGSGKVDKVFVILKNFVRHFWPFLDTCCVVYSPFKAISKIFFRIDRRRHIFFIYIFLILVKGDGRWWGLPKVDYKNPD